MRLRRAAIGAGIVCAWAVACGGLTDPLDLSPAVDASIGPEESGLSDSSSADQAPSDAAEADAFDSSDVDAGPPCDPTAQYDAALCAPPADDLFYATPAEINVPAANYGVASFTVSGPWVNDPGLYFRFGGATTPLQTTPYIMTNRPPLSFAFLVASWAPVAQTTFTATARDGNIEKTATVTVNVGTCEPWAPSVLCGSRVCGSVKDNCGTLTSCGTCPPDAPSCSNGTCIAGSPTYCPPGEGLGLDGVCAACAPTPTCQQCIGGLCLGLENVCICAQPPFPACPGDAPSIGSACPSIGQTCTWNIACGLRSCQCEPSYTWDCACDADGGFADGG